MVYYRKYRPQLISELDLESVREKLTAILSKSSSDNPPLSSASPRKKTPSPAEQGQSVPHAFLFAGPKGLGKTSSARILAKAINCENRKKEEVEPCNKCSACISITNGSAVDVLEIDAASNRGIDEIRDLRERIKFSPANLKTKVYIIDEVHMLTTEAFNALLKTLEEPPAHVIFILATTETGKLPATITSRTFLIPFTKPSTEELERSLERIIKGEDLNLESGVSEKIAELSDGAFRDAAKILEDLSLASKNKKITLDLLESLYKSGSTDSSVDKLIEETFRKNAKSALEIIDELSNQNADFKLVIEKMADKLHGKLLDSVSKNISNEIDSTKKLLELLDEAYKNLRGAVLPQLPLELAVIEFSLEKKPKESAQNEVQPQLASKKLIIGDGTSNASESPRASETSGAFSKEIVSSSLTVAQSTRNGQTSNSNIEILRNLINSVNQENKILAGLLRGCRIEEANGSSSIIIKAPSSFHLGKLNEAKNKEAIEKILGKTVAIELKS
jgi:DNA polymerase III subunit gamma/tau